MLAATVVGLTAGSDDLKPDLAACKAKTMELYKSADVSEECPASAPLRQILRIEEGRISGSS
jgi:hypothetical protein